MRTFNIDKTGTPASYMASVNTETLAGTEEATGSSEPNEHDYAHAETDNSAAAVMSSPSGTSAANGVLTVAGSFTDHVQGSQGHPTLSVELPGPAVGAEVDCPVGNETGGSSPPQTEEDPQKSATSQPIAPPLSGRSRCGRRRSSLPEDKNCSCCKVMFERQGRSFNRRAVYTFTTPETVQWAFPDASVHEKSFLCETCAQVIRSKCKRKQSGKRSLWLKPPVIKQVCV